MPHHRQKGTTMLEKQIMPLMEDASDTGGNTAIAEEVTEQPQAEAEMAEAQPQATETQTEAEKLQKLKINYMGEEREIDLEEAKTLAQKGMNYDPVQQKWEASKATISKFEEIARKAGFVDADGHGDLVEYQNAADEQLKAMEIERLTQGVEIPPELAEELYISRQERAERQAEKERQAIEGNRQREFTDLLDFYKDIHGKDLDPATTTLPKEVWQEGIPPKLAYAEYLAKELVKEKSIEQANADNAGISPGSVTGHGAGAEKEFFTSEELDRLSQKDLENPAIFDKAMKSLKKIGG